MAKRKTKKQYVEIEKFDWVSLIYSIIAYPSVVFFGIVLSLIPIVNISFFIGGTETIAGKNKETNSPREVLTMKEEYEVKTKSNNKK